MSEERIENAVAAVTPPTNGDYTEDSVQVLRDAAHIRRRPGVYIGDVGVNGLHHLAYELVYNSIDEALAGYCQVVTVQINVDGSLTVSDDGRGIPVEEHPIEKKPVLEVVMTTVGAGAKFDKGAYKTSAGLNGMGAKAVTALSEWVEARVRRNGRLYSQEYERGKATTTVRDLGPATTTGTIVTFKPDPEIFHALEFNYDTFEIRLRELAYLNKGVTIKLTDERTGKEQTFKAEGGISEFVAYLNRGEECIHKDVVYVDESRDGVRVEVAFQYTTSEEERVRCYTNNAYNHGGGTHLSGFRTALTRSLNQYGNKENLFKNVQPVGEDFREGLTGVVSVGVPEPQFESQTKIKLNNPEVDGIVAGAVSEAINKFLEEHPKEAQKIMKQVVLAAEAREAAAKARKALKERKSILNSGGLPGKLMDCTRDGEDSELFLVEGDSAGGSAESGRDRMYQAILPLRGKPLNVEKARAEKILANEEITNIISAVGIFPGDDDEVDCSKRRYGKIIILTDADVDGQHIRTLLLTFFYRQLRQLVDQGHIYVARPPLYKVTQKKNVRYIRTAEDMEVELASRGLAGTKLTVFQDGRGGPKGQTLAFENERLTALLQTLAELEKQLVILERRGLSLSAFLAKAGDAKGLPSHRVLLGNAEHWFYTDEEVKAFREAEESRGRAMVVGETSEAGKASAGNGHVETLYEQQLHEVKALNRGLEKLKDLGLGGPDLVPLPRIAGREPPARFLVESGDSRKDLIQLRDLTGEVRRLGEKGLAITRFKGLGEMDPEELWETTLDPAKRTLLQVKPDEAGRADELFRTLMGEKVEPRREFIQKHALEVKDIDWHGA
jgi:DNA gyrase subunit B